MRVLEHGLGGEAFHANTEIGKVRVPALVAFWPVICPMCIAVNLDAELRL